MAKPEVAPASARRLYRVTVGLEMFVMAESEIEALDVAQDHARDEMYNADCFAKPVGSIEYLAAEVLESIPWGSDDDRTIEQVFLDGVV